MIDNKILDIDDFITNNDFIGRYNMIFNHTEYILAIFGIYNAGYSKNIIKRKKINIKDIIDFKYINTYNTESNVLLRNIIECVKNIDNISINDLYINLTYEIDGCENTVYLNDVIENYRLEDLSDLLMLQKHLFINLTNIRFKLEYIQLVIYYFYIKYYSKEYKHLQISYGNFLNKELYELFLGNEKYNHSYISSVILGYITIYDDEIKILKRNILSSLDIDIFKLLISNNKLNSKELYTLYLKSNNITKYAFYKKLNIEKEILGNIINIEFVGRNTIYSFNYELFNKTNNVYNRILEMRDAYISIVKNKIFYKDINIINKYLR